MRSFRIFSQVMDALRVFLVALLLLGAASNGFAHASECSDELAAAAAEAGWDHAHDHPAEAAADGDHEFSHSDAHCLLHVCATVLQAGAAASGRGFVMVELAEVEDDLAPSSRSASQERPPRL